MVVRDVVQAMNAHTAAPLDCHVRLTVGHQFEGSGWFRFGENDVECESWNREEGRIAQWLSLGEPVQWMQCHPIVGDALLMKAYDLNQGPGKRFLDNVMLSSPDHRGATGPKSFPMGFGIQYVGEEPVTVKAGEFDARYFQVVDTAVTGRTPALRCLVHGRR